MVSSPIGGFMPIPLAMMPAFMAYQSILMGDSFGQAYQYGKRKISAMTNEDFNKLSISQLFENAQIEYDRMIPSLKQSMRNSQDLQGFIVKELLAIIPNLIKDAFGGTAPADRLEEESPFFKNTQATQQLSPTQIRYTTDRDPVINQNALDDLQKKLDQALQQQGGRIADKRPEITESIGFKDVVETTVIKRPDLITLPKEVTQATQFNNWNSGLSALKSQWETSKTSAQYWKNRPTSANATSQLSRQLVNNARVAQQIKILSNDYRNSNNKIRNAVLQLRKQIASGQWKKQTRSSL